MSSSSTYRSVALTAEQQRRQQARREIVRTLQSQLRTSASELAARQEVRLAQSQAFAASIAAADDLAGLREVARSIDAASSTDERGSAVAGARAALEIGNLRAELASIGRSAEDLATTLPGFTEAVGSLHEAETALRTSGPSQALALAGVLEPAVERLSTALDAAACRDRSVAAVRRALTTIGFAVTEVRHELDHSVVIAGTADGRTADIAVVEHDDDVAVSSEFTDPGTAVPAHHRSAADVCESAAADAEAFHEHLGGDAHLVAGEVHATDQPTRGPRRGRYAARRRGQPGAGSRRRGAL